tara:strand:+ start:49447 stop:51921 length:2475 start_codon:yes stop_codon:yes gene_type:complete
MTRFAYFLLILSSLSLSAQTALVREKASRLDYEMNSNGDIALKYTIWTNTASDFFFFNSSPTSTVDLVAPSLSFTRPLTFDTISSRFILIDTCREDIIEMVFRSNFFDPTPYMNGGSPVDFEVGMLNFLRDQADNMNSQSNLNAKLRLYPHQDINGQWVFDSTGTINSPLERPLAYPRIGKRTTLPLGAQSLGPGVDSVKVFRRPWEPGINFKAGYNYFYPFPDIDESSLNGNNVFSIPQRSFSFEVNTSANLPFLPFECVFPLRYEYYSAHGKFAESNVYGYAAFYAAAGISDAVASFNANGQFAPIAGKVTQDTVEIWLGDTLQIDLFAFKNADNLNWSLDFNGISPGFKPAHANNWQSGVFSSLNANGSFNAVGQSQARFTWIPGLNNYFQGPKNFKLIFNLGQGTCSTIKEKTLELNVQLKMPLQILSTYGTTIDDTLFTCGNDFNSGINLYVNAMDDSTSFYWSPGFIFGGRDSSFYQWPSFDTLPNGYIYIRRFSDDKAIDSVFIKTLVWPDTFPALSVKDDWIRLPDSIKENRSWHLNNLNVDYANYDSLPVLGSGTYQSWYYQEDYCPTPSDSLWVEGRFLSANFNHRDSLYQHTTLLYGPDSAFKLTFSDPVSSIYLKEINLLQVENRSTEARTLKYSFGDTNGVILEDSLIINPSPTSRFQQIPIEFAIAAQTSYYLEIQLAEDLRVGAYRDINFPQEIRVSRPMDFLSFEKAKGSGPLIPDSRPFGIGMVFDNFVNLPELSALGWSVYPNPAQDYLTVDGISEKSTPFSITDLQGRILQSGSFKENGRIVLKGLPRGSYILQIGNEHQIFMHQ